MRPECRWVRRRWTGRDRRGIVTRHIGNHQRHHTCTRERQPDARPECARCFSHHVHVLDRCPTWQSRSRVTCRKSAAGTSSAGRLSRLDPPPDISTRKRSSSESDRASAKTSLCSGFAGFVGNGVRGLDDTDAARRSGSWVTMCVTCHHNAAQRRASGPRQIHSFMAAEAFSGSCTTVRPATGGAGKWRGRWSGGSAAVNAARNSRSEYRAHSCGEHSRFQKRRSENQRRELAARAPFVRRVRVQDTGRYGCHPHSQHFPAYRRR